MYANWPNEFRNMKHYGIIGNPLEHSWSKLYFDKKFANEQTDAEYSLYEVDNEADLKPTLSQLDGCSITIPYKKAIIPYLSELDPVAKEIGAVNVVKKVQNAQCTMHSYFKGYNTDWIGFYKSIEPMLNENENENENRALIFGTGGAAMAVAYGLKRLGITYHFVGRSAQCTMHNAQCLSYETLTEEIIKQHNILINCTPLGMWPHVDTAVDIPYEAITAAHLLFDCVYNPTETLFLKRGREQGACTMNGLSMLHIQANEAWKIWNL